jgi:hypothetical protein
MVDDQHTKPDTKDLTGATFGRLRVITRDGVFSYGSARWQCLCECGKTCWSAGSSLRKGAARSCGCLRREVVAALSVERAEQRRAARPPAPVRPRHQPHGKSRTPEYRVWASMMTRCYNVKSKPYHNYGGRGITVCQNWKGPGGFARFLSSMGERPSKKHSIDRIDNDGGYWCGRADCPECGPTSRPANCRWATMREQLRNTRINRHVTHDGVTLTVPEWIERSGIDGGLFRSRLNSGWTMSRILTTPRRVCKRAG